MTQAHWVSRDTIAWRVDGGEANSYLLHHDPDGALHPGSLGDARDTAIRLTYDPAGLSPDILARFPHLAWFSALKLSADDLSKVPEILRGQIAVSASEPSGRLLDAASVQIPGVLDDLYVEAYSAELGIIYEGSTPTLRLWAPTAKSVTLHLFDDAHTSTATTIGMERDSTTGIWGVIGRPEWRNKYYLYEVEVYMPSTGKVERNLVTDPYSVSLSTNSRRSQIVNLADPALMPDGWRDLQKPSLEAPEDIVVYEIHIRDFSIGDQTVPEAYRGTYKAFTKDNANGMQHLRALAEAGLTHIHLLPAFDFATVNENKAERREPDPAELASYPPDSDRQQAIVGMYKDVDGYNWGYDPYHFTVPEGSYATEPDGATRILEFRQMVKGLSDNGLRVVMDVVYNHTTAGGVDPKSVLDKVVPGYYHRLDLNGNVETSTCCANTASEHAMMEKLMVDSLVTWATAYKVDAFRFDLMGHHMQANLIKVRDTLHGLTSEKDGVDGTTIFLYGEGWNFGEVVNNARGVNATQFNMAGTGIGTFNDRLRDAVRGGSAFGGRQDQGFINGLLYDPNGTNQGDQWSRLLTYMDWIRVGMAGNLRSYQFVDRFGRTVSGGQVDYNGQPAGYTEDPQEDINYIEAHDNETLFDIITYKAPVHTTMADRVRMQNLGIDILSLGQGIPFFHAGVDMLRSKSLDRDSYNSGDWFNRLDFSYMSNNFGIGLPPEQHNRANWPLMQPLLANPNLKPQRADILQAVAHFREMLRIRKSSRLFRLRTADAIQAQLKFLNTGPEQRPGLIVMQLSAPEMAGDDAHDPHDYRQIVVLLNATGQPQTFSRADLAGTCLSLHPVQETSYDPVVRTASFDQATGTFVVPARTTAVFVEPGDGHEDERS